MPYTTLQEVFYMNTIWEDTFHISCICSLLLLYIHNRQCTMLESHRLPREIKDDEDQCMWGQPSHGRNTKLHLTLYKMKLYWNKNYNMGEEAITPTNLTPVIPCKCTKEGREIPLYMVIRIQGTLKSQFQRVVPDQSRYIQVITWIRKMTWTLQNTPLRYIYEYKIYQTVINIFAYWSNYFSYQRNN